MFTAESAVFLLVSLLSAYIINAEIQKSFLFVMLSILLAILLVFFSRVQLAYLQQKAHRPVMLIALFLSSLFVQILVIATGGLFSAFVILLHLFTLGMSVLFNVSSAIVFLLLSVGLLMSSIVFDPQMKLLFQQDPWSVVLHGISFLVIIPLAHMLVTTYHLKDAISKMLSEKLQVKELQDESIFRGLGEMVFILDSNKKIIFANEAVKRTLSIDTIDFMGKELLMVLPLTSPKNIPINSQTLSIDQTLLDKSAHLVKGFSLKSKTNREMPVIIQIRPIEDTDQKKLKQIVVVITPDLSNTVNDTIDARIASGRRKQLITQLEAELAQHQDQSLLDFEILLAQINDIIIYKDLSIHPIGIEHKTLVEIAPLLTQLLTTHDRMLKTFHINYHYSSIQEDLVKTATMIHNNQFSLFSHTKFSTRTSLDTEWFEILFVMVIKLLSYCNAESPEHQLTIRSGFNDLDQQTILFITKVPPQLGHAMAQLLLPNYGQSGQYIPNNQGSGLEGFLADKISRALNCPLTLQFDPQSSYASAIIIPNSNS